MTTINEKSDTHAREAIAHILLIMISKSATGMASRCSTVPCSRSRISAAPVRMIDSMVTPLMMGLDVSAPP